MSKWVLKLSLDGEIRFLGADCETLPPKDIRYVKPFSNKLTALLSSKTIFWRKYAAQSPVNEISLIPFEQALHTQLTDTMITLQRLHDEVDEMLAAYYNQEHERLQRSIKDLDKTIDFIQMSPREYDEKYGNNLSRH